MGMARRDVRAAAFVGDGRGAGRRADHRAGDPGRGPLVSSGQFRLGQETDDRTVVVITVPPGGLEVCLPVTPAQRREARGAPLLLSHYDGSRWTTVVESRDRVQVYAPGGDGLFAVRGRVCMT